MAAWGGSLLAAAFLAADPVTSPMNGILQILYGLGAGVLCTLAAYYGFALPDLLRVLGRQSAGPPGGAAAPPLEPLMRRAKRERKGCSPSHTQAAPCGIRAEK